MVNKKMLETRNIKKSFLGNVAIENINLELYEGECLALVGENGAGKSTLMKILSGVYEKDEGEVFINGTKVEIDSPKSSQDLGISIIHQEFNLIPELTIAENVFLGREKTKGLLIRQKSIIDETNQLFETLKLNMDPNTLVDELSVAEKQLVEIVKAISVNANIIIMDEPTASLNIEESNKLFKIIEQFKEEGKGIIYISHHIEEFKKVADRISVLRDGKLVKNLNYDEEVDVIVEHMVGRKIENVYPDKNYNFGEVLFECVNVSGSKGINDISFNVKKGEVLGISGLMGSGQISLAEMLYGIKPIHSGYIKINEKIIKKLNPNKALSNKVAFVSEDRKDQGLILMLSIADNIVISNLNGILNKFKLVSDKKMVSVTNKYIERIGIKSNDPWQETVFLSGGNQQKVVFSKVLFCNPNIIILCEPTRGVDVGAKFEIYKLINELVKQGKGVILISSELPEVIGLSNRILVMNKGEISKELSHENISQEEIMYYATGNK